MCSRQLEIGAGKPGNNPPGGQANIGAISAVANAIHHLSYFFFSEAGISARVASLGAGITGGDALDIYGVVR